MDFITELEHESEALAEADRLMTICNSCRYCEGLCAVFPAMELRRSFEDGDLNYLANLCHSCGACYSDCQFSPPHEFNVNVPQTLAKVRADSYRSYAWPAFLQPMFDRNGLAISLVAALSVTTFIVGFALAHDPAALFGAHVGSGAFYKLMPHGLMASLFIGVSLFTLIALIMGFRNFWRDVGASRIELTNAPSIWQAVKDATSLRYLDGGGAGCINEDDKPTDRRRVYHHLTFWGFVLCYGSTSAATGYHYLLGLEAPYPWYDLPVVLGTMGGIGLTIGPVGLLRAKFKRDPMLVDSSRFGMETAFLAMLFFTAVTGLALLFLRETSAMGTLLALHLGIVFSLFVTMPYGKFVHGIYRFAALVRYAYERRYSKLLSSE
jgi:citrate/tricarballylate utilization protein